MSPVLCACPHAHLRENIDVNKEGNCDREIKIRIGKAHSAFSKLAIRMTGQQTLEEILKQRMRWLGHVNCMENNQIPKQAMDWVPENSKREADQG